MALSAQQTNDINAQYDPLRKKAQQQESTNLQTQKDALARRAAALSGGPSGAFIKQEGVAADASAQRLQSANEGIDAQQQASVNQARETQAARDFSKSERLGSESFQSDQNAINRKLAEAGLTGTYNGEATLAAKSAADQKALAEAGLTGTYNGQDTQAAKAASQQKALAEAGLTGSYNGADTLQKQAIDAANSQQKLENDANNKTNVLNSIISLKNSGVSAEAIGSVLQSLGLDKFGIDIGSIAGLTAAGTSSPQQTVSTGSNASGGVRSGDLSATNKLKSIVPTIKAPSFF